jgi:hypothetical protein
MSMLVCAGVTAIAGAIGGTINALLSDNGFVLPKTEKVDGTSILRPGMLGNALVGLFAALVSWGLYGPASAAVLVGGANGAPDIALTVGAAAGAIILGMGGARWLSAEVDKRMLRVAATTAATASPASKNVAMQIASASPAEAMAITRRMAS